MKTIQEYLTSAWKTPESGMKTTDTARETEDETKEECLAATMALKTEGKPLVLLQVNCGSIYNKILDFWSLIYTYKPDVTTGTEPWLSEEISNAEVFRADYKTFRQYSSGGGVFISVNNYITCAELWVDEVYEMRAVELQGRDPKITWEIVGIYTAPNEDMRLFEKTGRPDRICGKNYGA